MIEGFNATNIVDFLAESVGIPAVQILLRRYIQLDLRRCRSKYMINIDFICFMVGPACSLIVHQRTRFRIGSTSFQQSYCFTAVSRVLLCGAGNRKTVIQALTTNP